MTYPDGLLLFESLHPAPPEDVECEHEEEEGEDGERAGDDAQTLRVAARRRERGDGHLLAHLAMVFNINQVLTYIICRDQPKDFWPTPKELKYR